MTIDLHKHDDEPSHDIILRPDDDLELRPDATLVPQPPPQSARQKVYGTIIRRPAAVVAKVAKPQHVKTGGRVTVRAVYTTAQGWASWVHRAEQAWTWGVYREQIRIAKASGDHDRLKYWTKELKDAKNDRQERLKELPSMVRGPLYAVGMVALFLFMLMLVGGVLSYLVPGGWTWDSWWLMLGTAADTFGAVLQTTIGVTAFCAVPLLVWLAYREGKRVAGPPRWLVTDAEKAEMDAVIDERMISLALAHLGIAALNNFFKEGGHIMYLTLPRKDGDGTYAKVKLPMGVTADMIAQQRPKLAANLHRASLETWPTKAEEDGVIDLWVADKGVLGSGAGPWPLQLEGSCDVFDGVPFGRSQRGNVITGPLFETNWLIGGRPGQGKTAAMRTLLLGAALDPTAELWIFVFGESPDFKPFAPRLSRYDMGMHDEVFAEAIQALRDALAEMERRGKILGQQPGSPPKISRKLANKRQLGLHPLVISMDEVHELFMHPEYGKEACDLAIRLIKRGRKYGIILILATQSPTATSIPKEVTRNVGCGVAFSVQDHVASDGLLGTGKHKAGITATELRNGKDRGTCVTVGITENSFELIRTFYIPYEEGVDEVTPIITRAMNEISELRHTLPPTGTVVEEPPDHLADIWEVLQGEARVRTTVVLSRLAELDNNLYGTWTTHNLSEFLRSVDVPIGKSQGQSVVRAQSISEALDAREDT